MKWQIFADDQTEGNWFKGRSKFFDDAEIVIIQRKNNPEYIQKFDDRPDIILDTKISYSARMAITDKKISQYY